MTPDLAVQIALRARLAGNAGVVALVPATSILDRHARPAPDPSIILGEGQEVDEGTSIQRRHVRVYHTLHVWKKESGLEGVKEIVGAIRSAVRQGRLALSGGMHSGDMLISGVRYLRDADGVTAHAVVTVEVLVSGVE